MFLKYPIFITVTTTQAAIGKSTVAESRVASNEVSIKNFSQIDNVFNEYQYEMDGWDGSNAYAKSDADQRLSENLNDTNVPVGYFVISLLKAIIYTS